MHIVIMGCGRVGSMLARGLEERGHSVAVIDVNVDAFRRLGLDFQGITVSGVGFDREVLEAADIRHADGFAAVSSGDNSNILAARVVREQYGIDNVVARIYDQGRAAVYERLGIPTVATVRWTVGQVMRRLLPEGSEPVWRDPSGTATPGVCPLWLGGEADQGPVRGRAGAHPFHLPDGARYRAGLPDCIPGRGPDLCGL